MTTPGKNKWLYAVAGLIITANIVTLAMMWMHGKDHKSNQPEKPRQGQTFDYLSNELKFDQKQKDAYSLLRDAHHEAASILEDSLRHAKDELFDLLAQNGTTEDQILAKSNKAGSFNLRLDTLTFHHFQKVRMLCNADQQKLFDAVISEAVRGMGRGPGPGGNHPGGHPPPGEGHHPPPPGP